MEHSYVVAAQWILLALLASLISIRFGISVALVEILCGTVGANIVNLEITQWVTFFASFGAVILTFLAGVEIDPGILKKKFRESMSIGFISFLFPFLGAMAFAYYIFHWDLNAAKIAGIALSTTSVAVVYAVMIETGMNKSDLGQTILAACFITDLGTVVALGLLFTGFTLKLWIFTAALFMAVLLVTPMAKYLFGKFGGVVSEPEIKFIFLILAVLASLAVYSGSEAVLPAYIIGMAMAKFFTHYRGTLDKMRSIAFAAFTPFYFLKAGSLVSVRALWMFAGITAVFLLIKMAAKFIGIMPVTYFFKYKRRVAIYTTLLMSTGLTFGTISALYGLNNKLINQGQYSILVAAVILSAIVPTVIAQKYFYPEEEDQLGEVGEM
ncbi:MAG: sodium:proton exchanger [Peptococcaceae bacterium BRH_c4b]|nr:MAG: sodium:proton exchanger [Peptococcaceae bacterium BRH_c4b]